MRLICGGRQDDSSKNNYRCSAKYRLSRKHRVSEKSTMHPPGVRLKLSVIPGLIESGRAAAVHDEAVALRRDELRESDYCQSWDAGLAELVPRKNMPNCGWPPPLFPN